MPTFATMKNINKAVEPLGYEIVRGTNHDNGKDYFYFYPIFKLEDKQAPELYNSAVYTNALCMMSLEQWVETLHHKIQITEWHDKDHQGVKSTLKIINKTGE